MKLDLQKFYKLVDEGYLRFQKHPELDLMAWNYTEQCQFEKHWTEETLMCRGLITDFEGNVVARAFDKFFNLGEASVPFTDPEELEAIVAKHGAYNILEKYDGSLGIVFFYKNRWYVATRGSFTSEQAVRAHIILDYFKDFSANEPYTHLFEIIYPENRIVVNYGVEEKLVYLGSRDPKTGQYVVDQWVLDNFENAKQYEMMEDARENCEGYVLVFEDDFRIKVKHEEYKRLHRLVTGLSPKSIWEILASGGELKDVLVNVPDEFFKWAEAIATELLVKYKEIDELVNGDFNAITWKVPGWQNGESRKEFALLAQKTKHPGLIFSLLDKKESMYKDGIWKLLKPKADITFKPIEE